VVNCRHLSERLRAMRFSKAAAISGVHVVYLNQSASLPIALVLKKAGEPAGQG
jgi:hypothetical protein